MLLSKLAMKKDDGEVRPDTSVQERYCDRSEYSKLTPAQKQGLCLKRKQRNGTPNPK